MKILAAISAISFLVIVFSAYLFGKWLSGGSESRKVEISGKDAKCDSFRTNTRSFGYFELNNVDNPIGYKVYLQLSIDTNDTATIILAPNNDTTSSFYKLQLYVPKNLATILRNSQLIARAKFSPSEHVDVVLAVTNDNIFTLAIGGKTAVTYNDVNPFAINYFGVIANGRGNDNEVRLTYNCNSAAASNETVMNDIPRALEIERRILTGLRGAECDSYRTNDSGSDFFNLNSIKNARPMGYEVKLPLTIVVNGSATILLSLDYALSTHYQLRFNSRANEVRIWFNNQPIARLKFPSSELVDVALALTNDNIFTMSIDGKTVVTHTESNLVAINYFGIGGNEGEARFYYNCKNPTAGVDEMMDDLSENLDSERRTLAGLNTTECKSYKSQSRFIDYIKLDSLKGASVAGFKVNLLFTVIANGNAAIILSSKNVKASAQYKIQFNSQTNDIWLYRNLYLLAQATFSASEVVEVAIAITKDNELTVTVNRERLYTYNETNPFAISYVGFSATSSADEARFFYNCKPEQRDSTSTILKPKQMETPHCGKRKLSSESREGSRTKDGDWPWHSEIWLLQEGLRSYVCGGTLISANSVLTAAHCLYDLGRPILLQQVGVSLGKRNLDLAASMTQESFAQRLIIHEGYDQNTFINDIAIIRLVTNLTFTPYVQPICQWDASHSSLNEVVGRNGVVVGWGMNERDELPGELDLAYMPVISSADCLQSDSDFFGSFITNGTYCAGFRNGTGACSGYSGGGMYFLENGYYTLRGIVSQTKARNGTQGQKFCDPQHYVPFIDAAYYSNWIRENMK